MNSTAFDAAIGTFDWITPLLSLLDSDSVICGTDNESNIEMLRSHGIKVYRVQYCWTFEHGWCWLFDVPKEQAAYAAELLGVEYKE